MISRRDALVATTVIVVVLVAAVVTLSALRRDTTALLTVVTAVGLPVLAGLGTVLYQKLEDVHRQVNGNTSRMIEAIAKAPPMDLSPLDPQESTDAERR